MTPSQQQIDDIAIRRPFAAHPRVQERVKLYEAQIASHMQASVRDKQVDGVKPQARHTLPDAEQVIAYVRDHPSCTISAVAKGLGIQYDHARSTLRGLQNCGDLSVSMVLDKSRGRKRARYSAEKTTK